MISRELVVTYTDGTLDTCKGNDVFYWPPGHSVRVIKDSEVILFSPQREHTEVMDHMLRARGFIGRSSMKISPLPIFSRVGHRGNHRRRCNVGSGPARSWLTSARSRRAAHDNVLQSLVDLEQLAADSSVDRGTRR
jgi:hypothetical protein